MIRIQELQNFNLEINDPVINSLKDAISLSKDVFHKASSSGETLSFKEFQAIFGNNRAAKDSYTLFELSRDLSISKKEFRDSLFFFYKNRASLEKSIKSASYFITVIKRMIYGCGIIIFSILNLIIFGMNIQELFALVISVGIALNFLGSDIIKETLRNIMLLLSH